MWENLTPEAMKVNVVIDESSDSDSEKFSEEIHKDILPPEPKEV